MVPVFFAILITTSCLCILLAADRKKHSLSPLKIKQMEYFVQQAYNQNDYSQVIKLLSPYQLAMEKGEIASRSFFYHFTQSLIHRCEISKASLFISAPLTHYPKDLQFLYLKGHLLKLQGQYQEALKYFEKCRPLLIKQNRGVELADIYYQLQQYQKALDLLQTLPLPPSPQHLLLAGHCHFRMKNFNESLELYKQCEANYPHDKERLLPLAHSLRHLKRYTQAIDLFRKILTAEPMCPSSLLGIGGCMESKHDFLKALNLYRKSPQWSQQHPTLLKQAGICCLHLKKYRFAEIYLEKSLQDNNKPLPTYLFLAAALEKQSKWAQMEQLYFKLVQDFPKHVSGYRGLAWLFGVGLSTHIDSEMGISMAKKSLELINNASSWEVLSACEARAGNFSEAHHIQECLSSQSEDKETRRRRQQAMRNLRKKIPLNENLVSHNLVA